MRINGIAVKDLKVVTRDLKALASIIAMPLILIIILGTALGGLFTRSESISPFKVAVVDLDGGEAAKNFKDLLTSEGVSRLMTMVPVGDRDEAVTLIREQKVSAAVIIPEGTSDFGTMDTKTFEVLGDPAYALRGQITKDIVESYAQQYSAVFAGTSSIVSALTNVGGGWHPSADAIHGIQERLLSETTRATGVFSSNQQQTTWITASQYYTAGMTVMFVMFGAMLGAKTILEEKNQKTMARLFGTNATKGDIIVGKTLATFVISFLQIVVLIAFTALVYRTSWGDLSGVLTVTAALALAATGFSMLIAALSKTEKMADALENFGVQALAFLGGCQYPMYAFPPLLQAISRVTFTRWGLDAYLALMQGQAVATVGQHVIVLAGMGLAFLAVGIWRLKLD